MPQLQKRPAVQAGSQRPFYTRPPPAGWHPADRQSPTGAVAAASPFSGKLALSAQVGYNGNDGTCPAAFGQSGQSWAGRPV